MVCVKSWINKFMIVIKQINKEYCKLKFILKNKMEF